MPVSPLELAYCDALPAVQPAVVETQVSLVRVVSCNSRQLFRLRASGAYDAACAKAVLSSACPVMGSISSSSSATALQRHRARCLLLLLLRPVHVGRKCFEEPQQASQRLAAAAR